MFYFLAIFFLSLFDIIATHYSIVVYGSFAVEANPFMRWVMETHGLVGAYIVRMTLPCIGVPILISLSDRPFALWVLRIALATHVLLLLWHLYVTKFFTIHG